MMKKTFIKICCCIAISTVLGCSEQEETIIQEESYGTINVGGISIGSNITTSVSRSDNNIIAAESLPWLKDVLTAGIDIVYSNDFKKETGNFTPGKEQKAILKYDNDSKKYSFKYSEGDKVGNNAEWMSNGLHIFWGKYIPEALKNTSTKEWLNDQSSETNYNYLTHYTCMTPYPKSSIAATVNQISLPFQHRLARVIVQVVIDEDVKKDYTDKGSVTAQIKGYDYDAENKKLNNEGKDCMLRFCNVQVLDHVNNDDQPVWTANGLENKVIPHFLHQADEITIEPKDKEGKSIGGTNTYNNVPVFDLIVRPTYAGEDYKVMLDEVSGTTKDDCNQIFFSIELDNGMIYEKKVEFDLNPNEQTTIVLHISQEGVDYNKSSTSNWIASKDYDQYYGIDNELKHNLSDAGSCWQRAYQIGTPNYNVTDGSNPKETQYITEDLFKQYLSEAYDGGAHHGDYFILTNDIELPAMNITFTGHLDGRHHKIAISGGNALFAGLNGIYTGDVGTANINGVNSPMMGYRAEIMNVTISTLGASLVSGECTGNIYNCHLTGTTENMGVFCNDDKATSPGQITDCTKIE